MEAGTYMAVCVVVADLGEQYSEKFKTYSPKIQLAFEIPSRRITVGGEDKPCWIMEEYTASTNAKSNFCKMVTSWRGRAFTDEEAAEYDASQLLGKSCMISVTLDETPNGSYNNIASVVGLPEGVDAVKPESDLILFDWDSFTEEGFNALPEWLKTKLKRSNEYRQKYAIDEKLDFADEKKPDIKPEF